MPELLMPSRQAPLRQAQGEALRQAPHRQAQGEAARRGRPHQGAELVEKLDDCSEQARRRLKLIFQTLAGESTVEQACQALGIRRSAFNKLRSQFIHNAVGLLEPRTPGRRKRVLTPEQLENQRLRTEIDRLKFELQAQHLREQIGILMPRLLKEPKDDKEPAQKKTKPKRHSTSRPAPTPAATLAAPRN
jgi:hypothetical protein